MRGQARTSQCTQAHRMAGASPKEGSMKRQQRMRNAGIASAVAGMAVALVLTWGTAASAQFTEAELFFELNDTDGDLGIHASIDGEPWVRLEIEAPNDTTLLVVTAQGNLAKQGATQFMLESAEPAFDELSPERFFLRFPEGRYELAITNNKGREFEKRVRLSHTLAAPAVLRVDNTTLKSCGEAGLKEVTAGDPVLVDWDPVEMSHSTIGKRLGQSLASLGIEIVRYQFFFEQGDIKLSMDFPPDVTEFEVPGAITGLMATGQEAKVEVIARTSDLNNTAVEKCVKVVP
jgi:hypothetical protein